MYSCTLFPASRVDLQLPTAFPSVPRPHPRTAPRAHSRLYFDRLRHVSTNLLLNSPVHCPTPLPPTDDTVCLQPGDPNLKDLETAEEVPYNGTEADSPAAAPAPRPSTAGAAGAGAANPAPSPTAAPGIILVGANETAPASGTLPTTTKAGPTAKPPKNEPKAAPVAKPAARWVGQAVHLDLLGIWHTTGTPPVHVGTSVHAAQRPPPQTPALHMPWLGALPPS